MTASFRHILGIITARGGSKSIPKKSIALVGGKPLMYYTIKAAQSSRSITRLMLSTDDEEMADVARREGVEVPFMRPAALAEDLTPDLPVFQHALNWLNEHEGYTPDAVVHLRPTAPMRLPEDIDSAVALLSEHPEANAVHSMCAPLQPPIKMATVGDDGYLKPLLANEFPELFKRYREPFNMPRQVLPPVWRHSPLVDVIRTSTIMEKHSMGGTKVLPLFCDTWRDIDIDSPRELQYTELLIASLRSKGDMRW